MSKVGLTKLKHKIQDHMLLGSIYDNIMLKTKYRGEKLSFLYNVMVAQKHRMLYYKRLKKKYVARCTAKREWEATNKQVNTNTVWVCWLQGMDAAPELVKRCYESLQKQLPDKTIVLLDQNNIFEYITMPEDIVRKWQDGIIGAAHFTDLVRIELLLKYGGYWIDATVLCTDATLLRQVEQEPLFMYSFYYFGFNPEIMELNNWLIYSSTDNNVLYLVRELLYTYWREHNRAVHYFIFHLFLTMALEYYEEDYKNMPIVSQADAHILATYIFDEFDQKKYDILCRQTGIHKLSTRFDAEGMKKQGTFYDVVIRRGEF
ncbi:MAG: capsular polysaccharide synthesis protein [Lachnospiraceae bacterium]|nr:capsular polysaccharide synthesis protein [Lachnospiraceae bacterium]